MDAWEQIRRNAVSVIASEVTSNKPDKERVRLEQKYGRVWDTKELQKDFTVNSFLAPFVSVVRKSDGAKGSITFQHRPRFYFDFTRI